LAPRLTDTHIDVSSVSKMRVKFAVQVFSHSVASGIRTQIETNQLPPEARFTSEFIEKVDVLFDLPNTCKPFGEKPSRHAISANNNVIDQLELLNEWISEWKFNSRTASSIKCIWGLQVSIASIVALSKSLLNEGFQFVATMRFNQDCVENFFAGIRSKQGWHENPNCAQFSYAFRKSVVLASLDSNCGGKNCVDDDDFVLISHADIVAAVPTVQLTEVRNNGESTSSVPDLDSSHLITAVPHDPWFDSTCNEVIHFDVPLDEVCEEKFSDVEETLINYLSGWVARKSGICRQCQEVLQKEEDELAFEHSYACRKDEVFTSMKRYSGACSLGLFLPHSELCNQIRCIEQQFRLKFCDMRTTSRLATELYNCTYPLLNYNFLFVKHPEHAVYLSQKITKLYIVMRIFYAVKFLNRDLSSRRVQTEKTGTQKSEKTRKMKKVMHK